jgi:WD40 repeat protein
MHTEHVNFSTAGLVKEAMGDETASNDLELYGVIGFNGAVPNGLILHPGDEHIIYPLGSSIVVKHLTENTQTFLQTDGHTNNVSCLALSSTGKYLASGETTYMGFGAQVIIWNLETYEVHTKLHLHKGAVQDVSFSEDEQFVVTLGGRDDNKLVVWRVEDGQPICGDQAASETARTVRFTANNRIVSGGNYNLRVWDFDPINTKLRPNDCALGTLKRTTAAIVMDDEDEFMYCGTESGDILEVSLGPKLFKRSGPSKKEKKFSRGVRAMTKTLDGKYLIVGAGDGSVALVDFKNEKNPFKVVRTVHLDGGITSLALNAAGDHFFVGTEQCNMYLVHIDTFEYELRSTCHYAPINGVAFPRGYSELFATCSKNDIRVWHATTRNELLRIQVPTLECFCVAFAPDGRSIISGWSDGKIRAFKPQTGKLLYVINDAHRDGVTALALYTTAQGSMRLISGGQAGIVRVWEIKHTHHRLLNTMKEHKSIINAIRMIESDDGGMPQCISASSDGSCIVWNLETYLRNACFFAATQFKDVVVLPDGSQVLTCGTDRKVSPPPDSLLPLPLLIYS